MREDRGRECEQRERDQSRPATVESACPTEDHRAEKDGCENHHAPCRHEERLVHIGVSIHERIPHGPVVGFVHGGNSRRRRTLQQQRERSKGPEERRIHRFGAKIDHLEGVETDREADEFVDGDRILHRGDRGLKREHHEENSAGQIEVSGTAGRSWFHRRAAS